jgi:signal peptide peptidase SppA
VRRQRFAPHGTLALMPSAFGVTFDLPDPPAVSRRGETEIVTVRGPLMHHADPWFDSYDEIRARVRAALETKPRAVVLSIDSPGGLVSGCFDCAADLRAQCAAAGVPLVAYLDGCSTSAAYALACAAGRIYASETACVGSIGVIDALVDATQQDAMMGVRIKLITSGARKADGNPHASMTDDAITAAQSLVDSLAEAFFALVANARGISVDDVRALQAGLTHGAGAVALRLVDEVATIDQLLASITSGATATKGIDMSATATEERDEVVAKLRKLAEGDDEDEARRAKKALEAFDGEGEEEDDDEEISPDAEEGDDEEPEASKADTATALKALAEVHKLRAELAAKEETTERKELLASRPDFGVELVAALSKAPMATVRELVKTLPRAPQNRAAATATVQGTRGAGQGGSDAGVQSVSPHAAAMDHAMGLASANTAVRREGNRSVFPVKTRDTAAKPAAGGAK